MRKEEEKAEGVNIIAKKAIWSIASRLLNLKVIQHNERISNEYRICRLLAGELRKVDLEDNDLDSAIAFCLQTRSIQSLELSIRGEFGTIEKRELSCASE